MNLTGIFDEQTQAVLKNMQASQSIQVTGELNDETVNTLNRLLAEKIHQNDTQLQKAIELVK